MSVYVVCAKNKTTKQISIYSIAEFLPAST